MATNSTITKYLAKDNTAMTGSDNNNSIPKPTQDRMKQVAAQTKPFGTPRLCSLRRMKENGLNWREALSQPSSVYISTQEAKYTGNPKARDFWVPPQLSWRHYIGEISVEEYLWEYERYCRHYLWNYLDTLENKTMYCWCSSGKVCHGRVLQKLFNEKKAMSATPPTKEISTQTEDVQTMKVDMGGVDTGDKKETTTLDMGGDDTMDIVEAMTVDMAGVDAFDVWNMEY